MNQLNRCFITLLLLTGLFACRQSAQSASEPSITPKQATAKQAKPQATRPKSRAIIRKRVQPKVPVARRVIQRKPPEPRWYRPRYRERGFYPPRQKLKQLPPSLVKVIPPTIIHRGSRKSGMVALTFDACSWNTRPRFDRKVANILIRTKTPATLFMGGLWVLKRSKDAKWLASFPFFEIANHAYRHGHLTKVSKKRLVRELQWTQEAIYTVLGRIPTLFRAPYLELNRRVAKVAGQYGLKTINGLSSGDPDPTFTKSVLIRYMKKAIKPGSIVVMHINKGGKHTAEALPTIIKNIKKKGYRLVTVGTMLKNGGGFPK